MKRQLIALLAAAGVTACGKTKTEPTAHEHAAATQPAAPAVDEHAGHGAVASAHALTADPDAAGAAAHESA